MAFPTKVMLVLLALTLSACIPAGKISNNFQADDNTGTALDESGEKVYNQLSLPSFATQEFMGSDLTIGSVLAQTNTYTRYYMTYKSGGLTISGIINIPHGDGPFPVLFLNHGFIDPAVYTNGRGLKREQDYLAQRGYIV